MCSRISALSLKGSPYSPHKVADAGELGFAQALTQVSARMLARRQAGAPVNFETRLTVIDRVPADDPHVFPPSTGIAADPAQLFDFVSRLVPPRPPVSGASANAAPAMFPIRAASASRSKLPAPQLALVRKPAPAPDYTELAYQTCDWTPDG